MAETVIQHTRLLGFASLAGADVLESAMRAVPGPHLHMQVGPSVVAFLQEESDASLVDCSREELLASLPSVQLRLKIACSAGAFLAMDPAAACGPAEVLCQVLERSWDVLAEALAQQGTRQQWDILLSWAPEVSEVQQRATIASAPPPGARALAEAVGPALLTECVQREAALLAALAPAVLMFAGGGAACSDTQIAITALVVAGGEAALRGVLDELEEQHFEGARIDLLGPLPPLRFSAVRLAILEEQAITQAWLTLRLGDRVDLAILHRHWREGAAALHPNRAGSALSGTLSDLTIAHDVLRDLLPLKADEETLTLSSLLRLAGTRLLMPREVADWGPQQSSAPEGMVGRVGSAAMTDNPALTPDFRRRHALLMAETVPESPPDAMRSPAIRVPHRV